MKLNNNSFFRFYKLFFYCEIFKMEVDFIDKNVIDRKVLLKAKELSNNMHAFKLSLKRMLPEFNSIFEDLSNEKIFSIITVINKMLLMSEEQCLEFENSLIIEEKNEQ